MDATWAWSCSGTGSDMQFLRPLPFQQQNEQCTRADVDLRHMTKWTASERQGWSDWTGQDMRLTRGRQYGGICKSILPAASLLWYEGGVKPFQGYAKLWPPQYPCQMDL